MLNLLFFKLKDKNEKILINLDQITYIEDGTNNSCFIHLSDQSYFNVEGSRDNIFEKVVKK